MKRLPRTLLCICCAALMLCLPAFAEQLPEGYESKTYTDENGHEVQEIYDKSGLLVGKGFTDSSGVQIVEFYAYDANQLLIMKETIDSNGKDVKEYYSYFAGTSTLSYKMVIDNDDNALTEEYDPNGSLKSTRSQDAAGNTSSTFYNEDGTPSNIYTKDAAGNEKRVYLDLSGGNTEIEYLYTDGSRTVENYDADGALCRKKTMDASGKEIFSSSISWFSRGGSVNGYAWTTVQDGIETREEYDTNGTLLNKTVKYNNDDQSRRVERYLPDGTLEDYYLRYLDANGIEVWAYYTPDGLLTRRYWEDAGRGTTEYYDDAGNLSSSEVSYTKEDEYWIENYAADGSMTDYQIYSEDADSRSLSKLYTPDGILKAILTSYQENGLDYEMREYYEKDGTLSKYDIYHEEDGKGITAHYSGLRELESTGIYYINEDGHEIIENYDASGTLVEKLVYDAEGHRIE